MDKFIDIFGSTESVFIHDKNHQNQHERVKNWQSSLEVTTLTKILRFKLNVIFQTLLGDTLGCLIFSDFLEDEFSSENLHFLLAAYAFSKTQGQIEMRTKAELLINSYI